jgi:Leucine-rich repeat (LRR) protein
MRDFDLSGNALSGSIPSSLGNMTQVNVEIDLHNNLLTGGLPASFQNLTQLTTLDLGGNNLNDEASLSVLGDMTGLMFIDLRNNGFSGQVPGIIGTLPSLIFLDLSDENNIGQWNSLESGFGDSVSLATLDMSGNNFTTAVFNELPPFLTELDLSANSLSGLIPTTIGTLTSLVELDLSANTLSGAVPTEITNLTSIEVGSLALCPNGALTTAAAPDPVQMFVDARDPLWVITSCTA